MAPKAHAFVEPTPKQGRPQDAQPKRGVFITFEGGDGAGKSTHIGFLSRVLEGRGLEVVRLREPGGTEIGEKLRQVVLDVNNKQMVDECELLIYEAARAQIVKQVIAPALDRGAVVLCDRFYDSTVAYQAYGRGLSIDFINVCNQFVCHGVTPDRTILMVTGGDANVGLERATHRFGADRLEMAGADFHTRVNQGFLEMQHQDPDRIRLVVSDDLRSNTARKVFEQLSDLFPWMADADQCPDSLFRSLDERR